MPTVVFLPPITTEDIQIFHLLKNKQPIPSDNDIPEIKKSVWKGISARLFNENSVKYTNNNSNYTHNSGSSPTGSKILSLNLIT